MDIYVLEISYIHTHTPQTGAPMRSPSGKIIFSNGPPNDAAATAFSLSIICAACWPLVEDVSTSSCL